MNSTTHNSNPATGQSDDRWSAYWRDGRTAACREDDSGLYRGAIAHFWTRCFQEVSATARILDLATGNGAVLEVAAQVIESMAVAEPSEYWLVGVDQARIAPRLLQQPPAGGKVLFYPLTCNEALPFAAAMFDRVTSQYGVEYGDLQRTASETWRVLKAGGRLCWVCHWHEGSVARGAAREVADIDYLESLALPAHMAALIRRQVTDGRFITDSHRKTAHTSERRALQEGLNLAFERLREHGHKESGNLPVYLRNLAHIYQYREQYSPELVLSKVQACERELLLHKQRLQALVAAALTRERLAHLLQTLAQCGLVVQEHGTVCEDGQTQAIGYFVTALKPG